MNRQRLLKIRAAGGRKGGRSKSAAKVKAARRTIKLATRERQRIWRVVQRLRAAGKL